MVDREEERTPVGGRPGAENDVVSGTEVQLLRFLILRLGWKEQRGGLKPSLGWVAELSGRLL